MKTVYAEQTLMVEAKLPPRAGGGYSVMKTAGQYVAPADGAGVMQIVATGGQPPQPATWSVKLVPHHGQAAGSAVRRNGFQKWFAKLQSLARLKDGWDSYKAPAPGQEAITSAELYLSTLELLAWEPARVEASVMGGVGITHRQGTRKAYVEFYNDGRAHALFSDRTPNMQTFPVGADLQSYYRFVGKAREYLNG